MGSDEKPAIGAIGWRDLTVPDAERVRDFYGAVVGWRWSGHDMGAYEDFNILLPGSGETVAGICHAREENASMPAQWMIYITVESLERSMERCTELGGKVRVAARDLGSGRMCVIEDPAGAVAALWEPR